MLDIVASSGTHDKPFRFQCCPNISVRNGTVWINLEKSGK